jgi:hypothetical protein
VLIKRYDVQREAVTDFAGGAISSFAANKLAWGLQETRVGGNDRAVNSVSDGLAMDFVCVVRQAEPEELPRLSELCLRSKGIPEPRSLA